MLLSSMDQSGQIRCQSGHNCPLLSLIEPLNTARLGCQDSSVGIRRKVGGLIHYYHKHTQITSDREQFIAQLPDIVSMLYSVDENFFLFF